MELPKKKYNIIYADPPWKFVGWNVNKSGKKSPSQHYECQDLDWIKNLSVKNIADKDCILFMWTTFPVLEKSFEVIKSWGFNYSTCGFVWVKTNKRTNVNQTSFFPTDSFDSFWGLGYWTRSNVELCLIAKKGSIKRQTRSIHQLIYEPVREHSRKPDCARDRIVELCGDLPRIELFARTRCKGWDSYGDEL